MTKSIGFKIFIAYLLFTYIAQLGIYYGVEIKWRVWRSTEPSVGFYFSLVGFVIAFILVSYSSLTRFRNNIMLQIMVRISNVAGRVIELLWFRFRFYHVLLFLGASLLWYLDDLSRYRYDGVNVGSKFSLLLGLVVILKAIILLDFWYHLTMKYIGKESITYKYKYLINIALLLSLTGTTSVMYYIVHSLYIFLPTFSNNLLHISISNSIFKKPLKMIGYSFFGVIFIFILSYAYHFGEIIKTGKDMSYAERYIDDGRMEVIQSFFAQRFSTTLYAHTVLVDEIDYSFIDYVDHWSIPLDNIRYRADVVLGNLFGVERPRYAQISQLNYQTMLIRGQDKTSGASPGMIPGFLYILPLFLAIPFAAFVTSLIISPINNVVKRGSFIYAAITVLLLLNFFKAIIDAANPISQNFAQLLFFVGIIGIMNSKTRSA